MQTTQETCRLLAAVIAERQPPSSVPAALWPTLIAAAIQHGVGPVLLRRIREAGEEPPDIDLTALKDEARRAAIRHALLETQQARIDAALAHAGIAAVWLKGIVLARLLYPDPALRPMTDLDVLVPAEQRETALRAVQAEGYAFRRGPGLLFSTGDARVRRWAHHDHLTGGPGGAVIVELHSRLLSADETVLPPEALAWFTGQTITYHVPAGEFRTLSPAAHFLYLCAHAELQHADLYLQRYYDLHLMIARALPDWQEVLSKAVGFRWTYAIERALATCSALFGTPVPPEVPVNLRNQRPADEDVIHVQALREPGARWMRVRRKFALLTPAQQLSAAFRIAVPHPAYMRQRYAIRAGQPVWPYYFYRWFDQVREIILAVLRHLRRR